MKRDSIGIGLCAIGAFIFAVNQLSASIFSITRSFNSYDIFLKNKLSISTNIIALIYSLIGIILILNCIITKIKK